MDSRAAGMRPPLPVAPVFLISGAALLIAAAQAGVPVVYPAANAPTLLDLSAALLIAAAQAGEPLVYPAANARTLLDLSAALVIAAAQAGEPVVYPVANARTLLDLSAALARIDGASRRRPTRGAVSPVRLNETLPSVIAPRRAPRPRKPRARSRTAAA